MWNIISVHTACQCIQTCGRCIQRNRKCLLMNAILLACFLVIIIFTEYRKEYTKYINKSDYVLQGERLPMTSVFDQNRDSSQLGTENIQSVNFLRVVDIPLLTLFTSWRDRKDKYIVHNRTLENWRSLWPHAQPVIFTNDTTLGGQCRQRGWSVLPLTHTTIDGVPVLKQMYLDAKRRFSSTFYGFSNSDILFNDGLIKTLIAVREFMDVNWSPVLITGRRTNVDYKLPCNVSDWKNITSLLEKGKLASPLSADYFITTKAYPWEEMEEIIIGHNQIDNWIIQFSHLKNVKVINSTPTILALHQTTETGNSEGGTKLLPFYNIDIISKVRNIRIDVNQGQTG